jgi:Tfp pilus assembly protein PilF
MRAGEYEQALASLDESIKVAKPTRQALNYFVKAICHHHLGKPDEARSVYAEGVDRLIHAGHGEFEAYVLILQAEAEQLLGTKRE